MPFQEQSYRLARALLLSLLAVGALCGCNDSPTPPPAEAPTEPEADSFRRYELRLGDQRIHAELATNRADQMRGLMHRESMPEDAGMLFVFERPRAQTFWMKNTLIPLDIGFFTSDGKLREIYTMTPKDLASTHSYRPDIQFALEMNAGWFAQNQVRVGTYLDLESLRQALREHNENPERFGL